MDTQLMSWQELKMKAQSFHNERFFLFFTHIK